MTWHCVSMSAEKQGEGVEKGYRRWIITPALNAGNRPRLDEGISLEGEKQTGPKKKDEGRHILGGCQNESPPVVGGFRNEL